MAKDVALALSSGGARGLAHIGAIEHSLVGYMPLANCLNFESG